MGNNKPTIRYANGTAWFGEYFIAAQGDRICALSLTNSEPLVLSDWRKRFPTATFVRDNQVNSLLQLPNPPLTYGGTPLQHAVWTALQAIPSGETRTYSEIAAAIGKPKAVRAVATAIGQNPIAVLIPCHRVILSSGALGNFYYGTAIKAQLLTAEAACRR